MTINDDSKTVICAALATSRIARAAHRANHNCPANGAITYLGRGRDYYHAQCEVCRTKLYVRIEDVDDELDKTPVETPTGKRTS